MEPGGPPYAVQLGAFRREANARALQERLEAAAFPVWTTTNGATTDSGGTDAEDPTLLRVRVGATSTVADARRLVTLINNRLPDAPENVWIAPLATEGGTTDEMLRTTAALLEDG
ncbi:MAG: SPOR domain-containing protein [Longimicrobiales bacterium]|nr:SPOR domain-containing protein [Longimicrobiales bacterium]